MKYGTEISSVKTIFFLIFLMFVFGCTQTGNKFLDDKLFCNVDGDCTLGRLTAGDKCFPANKLYFSKMYAKEAVQNCQRKDVKCVSNQCVLIDKKEEKIDTCRVDTDCVPKQCCHATECVLRGEEPNCAGIACTEECRGGTMDCGGGCKCINEKCKAETVNLWE